MSNEIVMVVKRADREGTDFETRLTFSSRSAAALGALRVMWALMDVYGNNVSTRENEDGTVHVLLKVDGKEVHIVTIIYYL